MIIQFSNFHLLFDIRHWSMVGGARSLCLDSRVHTLSALLLLPGDEHALGL